MYRSMLKKHSAYLILLAETRSKAQHRQLLETITQEQFKILTLVLYNILQRRLPAQARDIAKLRKYRNVLETITDRKVGAKQSLSILKANPHPVAGLLDSALAGLKTVIAE